MQNKHTRFHIGLRTVKTVTAVVIAMLIVDSYGATTSKLIFAMLGAMAAMENTFKQSVQACVTQILSVLFGGLVSVFLLTLPISPLAATGIGIVLVIMLYNAFRIRLSPSLACFIVVTLCITPDIQPMTYALGRIWDTAIGLGVGLLVNILIFPYDNRHQIRATMESLDRELILFLEDMFDGDDILPDPKAMSRKIDDIDRQLKIFANQKFPMHAGQRRQELEHFRSYEETARHLIAHMEVLCQMKSLGRLDEENRQQLSFYGATIGDARILDEVTENDLITNYHVKQILALRQELLQALGN